MKQNIVEDTGVNSPDNFYVPSKDKINTLKSILEKDLHKHIPYKDAEEIGIQLIALYECLARKRTMPSIYDDQVL